jgi:hypothetical protein
MAGAKATRMTVRKRTTNHEFRVTGIGGVFLRARNQKLLLKWYERHLGIHWAEFGGFTFQGDRNPRGQVAGSTTLAIFPHKTDYFGSRRQGGMVNYRVQNLDGLLARLRRARVRLDPHIETEANGRFAWAYDLEGNRFELWEPREISRGPRRSKRR